MKAVICVTTKSDTARMSPFATAIAGRWGTEATVVLIDPVEYSEVITNAPRTPTTISVTKDPA